MPRALLRPEVALTFHRHWNGRAPLLDDDADVLGKPCAMCAQGHRARRPRPPPRSEARGARESAEFDEQTVPLHSDCLAAVSTSRLF